MRGIGHMSAGTSAQSGDCKSPSLVPYLTSAAPTKRRQEGGSSSSRRAKRRRPAAASDQDAEDGKEKRQMYLDFGQKSLGHTTCSVCSMVYTRGLCEDEADHLRFHKLFLTGVRFPGWKRERVVHESDNGRVILVLQTDSKQHLKKVESVRELVDFELGYSVDKALVSVRSMQTFLFVSERRVAGCVMAERIREGYPVVYDENKPPISMPFSFQCSESPEPAAVGINRMWVCPKHRRRGIASTLLDCVRSHFLEGRVVDRKQLAFSDPTPDGLALASHYTGTMNVLVYQWP